MVLNFTHHPGVGGPQSGLVLSGLVQNLNRDQTQLENELNEGPNRRTT